MHGSRKPARFWLALLAVFAMIAAACAPEDVTEDDTVDDPPEVADPEDDVDPEDPEDDTEEPAEPEDEEDDEELAEDEADPEGEPVEGGTVVFGHEQEPAILNSFLTAGNLAATSLTTVMLLQGSYEVTPDFEYVPQMIDGEAETTEDPFTVTYNIREEVAWNDGTPVTADDYVFTFETIMNEEFDLTSRAGYELITDYTVNDDKSVTFEFEEIFAPYRTIFNSIMPAHVLEGEDFNEVWNDGIVDPATGEAISSGPFQFEEWQRGQQMSVVRNDNYWDEENMASLDRIVLRYIEETPTLVQQIRGGEINIFDPQPQIDVIQQLEEIDGVNVQVDAGPAWEHLTFNLEHPVIGQTYVRQAIAHAIDRAAIVNQLIAPVNPEAEVLQNPIWLNNSEYYQEYYDIYDYNPDQARQLLEENGCEEGDPWVCDGEPLEFNYVSTAGNERRELMFEIIQAQLAEVGIIVNADFSEPSVALGERLPAGDFDIINHGWVGSPDPFGSNTIWICDGRDGAGLNYSGYCNEEVDALIAETNNLIDADERAQTYNDAVELIAQDNPILPIFQTAEILAYEEVMGGVEINATQWGPTWNAQDWYLTE